MFTPLPVYRDSAKDLASLFESLQAGATNKNKNSFSCKKHTNTVHGVAIDSWKINEWDYYLSKELPTYARGLFTVGGTDSSESTRIAVRGYNKFFNLGEKGAIDRDGLEDKVKGPFYLSLKENGCIIFISGLESGELLVCSKHSIGYREDLSYKNHALEGEAQLFKQLKEANIDPKALGKKLFELNITLVAELCDDDFEEHVLRYTKEQLGLYLHGLVFNAIKFKTYPMDQVEAFAKEWGFKSVQYVVLDTVKETLALLDECAKTGTYKGKEAEGFVIRCFHKEDLSDYFFKYKFKEPYLFYRQLREVAKKLWLSNTPIHKIMVNVKVHKALTLKYLEFLNKLDDPELKEDFAKSKGIIKLREMFFESISSSKNSLGYEIISSFDELDKEMAKLEIVEDTKFALVPVATIGCGKTTIFNTLVSLYPSEIGHIQNDNLGKKAKKQLVSRCLQELAQGKQIVCVDKNNHERMHRVKLFADIAQLKQDYLGSSTSLKVIALDFTSSLTRDELNTLTLDRIAKRGNNHQMIKFDDNESEVKRILNQFTKSLQQLDTSREPDMLFDEVISLDPRAGSLKCATTIIKRLREIWPELPVRSIGELDEAFDKALNMKTSPDAEIVEGEEKEKKKKEKKAKKKLQKKKDSTEKEDSPKQEEDTAQKIPKKSKRNIVFVGIKVPAATLEPIINKALSSNEQWKNLRSLNRVQKEFHVTLCHRVMTKSAEVKPIWKELLKLDLETIKASITLVRIVIHENRLICIEVAFKNFSQNVPLPPLITPHITIGTFSSKIKPVELNTTMKLLAGPEKPKDIVLVNINEDIEGLSLVGYTGS